MSNQNLTNFFPTLKRDHIFNTKFFNTKKFPKKSNFQEKICLKKCVKKNPKFSVKQFRVKNAKNMC
mgnify:CR=1 FL=1